jgi:programmed cell death 6-interacting protein
LPASIEDVSGLNKVPQSLLDKSQIIKDKGGISKIDHMMADLPSLMQRNSEILSVAKRSLEEEERSDTELRNQMKDKWTRTQSRQLTEYLHSEIKQYETLMENAVKANKIIETKYKKNRDGIQLLSKSPNDIASSLPAATPVAALQSTHVVKDLRRLMDEVEGLKNVREVLESEMKSMDSDALNAKLVSALQVSNSLDEHSIIQNELDEILGPIKKQVRENIQEQEKILGYIEKANSEFNKEKVQNETSKMRDEMLKNLASASDSYNELHNHLEEGIKVILEY